MRFVSMAEWQRMAAKFCWHGWSIVLSTAHTNIYTHKIHFSLINWATLAANDKRACIIASQEHDLTFDKFHRNISIPLRFLQIRRKISIKLVPCTFETFIDTRSLSSLVNHNSLRGTPRQLNQLQFVPQKRYEFYECYSRGQ